MDQAIGWLAKLLFIVMVAPFAICLVVQLAVGLMTALLPWVLLVAVVAGVAGGLAAGLVLRRRLPLARSGQPAPPPVGGQQRVKRPRGVRGREED